MTEFPISLTAREDGSVLVAARLDSRCWEHTASPAMVKAIRRKAADLNAAFESGMRPLTDAVTLAEIGRQLRDTFLAPMQGELENLEKNGAALLLFSSENADCLNLPWELLPGSNGRFLVEDARWTIRRTTRTSLPENLKRLPAGPLRILFVACAPTNLVTLDFEKEEDAILRIAHKLGGKVHLDIAEAGTFDELRDLISEYRPHVVHLSGHGSVQGGVGSFAFENERGTMDSRDAHEMAAQLFAGRDVRLVFVNGCQSAQSAVAGLCQTLTASGHVPLALGWGSSIADDHATDFARVFFHEAAAGSPVDLAVAAARQELLKRCRVRDGVVELLDASFALPQIYAADRTSVLVDHEAPPERIGRTGVRYTLLGDNIRGLREGFVGRRRLLQRTRPPLRSGDKNIVLLTGIGGAGKSTLATRLANRCERDGFRIVALQARRSEAPQFCLKLLAELATTCQRMDRGKDESMLLDGNRPIANRLRLAVEILNEAKILLVLDNLESLMPAPPSAPVWDVPEFAGFFRELTSRLTGEGRAVLTCRYLPSGFDPAQSNLGHEPMPDFTEADFFKYLRRRERVSQRMDSGELSRALLTTFYRKLGATPRFIEQASVVLARIDPSQLGEQLETINEPGPEMGGDELWQLQQAYFRDLFLPQLYEALSPEFQLVLSRLALLAEAMPMDGIASVAVIDSSIAAEAVSQCLGLGLLQRFGEKDDLPLFAVYPLQRDFFTTPDRLPPSTALETHAAAAAFFQESLEKGRAAELRLGVVAGLLACLHHATKADDVDRRIWAINKLASQLIRKAEYVAVLALVEPLLSDLRHPDLLKIAGKCTLDTDNWPQARAYFEEEQMARQSNKDRAGEASTWHQLATIDVKEGNYAAAREKFGKSLVIKQAIGDHAGEASTWHNLATIDSNEGNYSAAREKSGKSLTIEQAIGDRAGEASTWHQLASIDLNEGNYSAAREKFGKSLAMRQAIGDRAGQAATWHQLASIDIDEGNYSAAREKFGKSLAVWQAIGDRAGEASTWHQLASIDLNEGNYSAAREKFGKSLVIKQAIGDLAGEAATCHQLAMIDLNEGNYSAAREKFGKSLAMLQAIGDRAEEAATWHGLATVDINEGNYSAAREKFGKSLAMRQAIGDRVGQAATWHQLASIDLDEGNYSAAREKFGKSLAIGQAIGDRAGKAATWHQLATIDLREGNYSAAREKFGKSLVIKQAIGDLAGEAATFFQIGFMCWQIDRRDAGVRLVGMCLLIEHSIGSGGAKETMETLGQMATALALDQAGFNDLLREAGEHYQRDRGAELVRQAFEGLD